MHAGMSFKVKRSRQLKMFKTFSLFEKLLFALSTVIIIAVFVIFDRNNYLALTASLIGVSSLILNAKGNPLGQVLMIIFSIIYGIISFGYAYYGEMITYLGMTAPMAAVALIAWLKHPYKDNKREVSVAKITSKDLWLISVLTVSVTLDLYFIVLCRRLRSERHRTYSFVEYGNGGKYFLSVSAVLLCRISGKRYLRVFQLAENAPKTGRGHCRLNCCKQAPVTKTSNKRHNRFQARMRPKFNAFSFAELKSKTPAILRAFYCIYAVRRQLLMQALFSSVHLPFSCDRHFLPSKIYIRLPVRLYRQRLHKIQPRLATQSNFYPNCRK